MSPTTSRLAKTAAAAISSTTIAGSGFAYCYYFMTDPSNHEKDEKAKNNSRNENNSSSSLRILYPPTAWMAMSTSARETLLPIHRVSCDVDISDLPKETIVDPSYPDLKRFGNRSYLKRYLTPEVYNELKDKKTSTGVTLEDLIKSGVSLPWGARPPRGCGIYAGDAESYQVFAKILEPILEDYHHFHMVTRSKQTLNANRTPAVPAPNSSGSRGRPNPVLRRQVTNLNPGYVLRQKLDPEGQYILQTRMRVARSIDGFRFSPVITRAKRREIEKIFQECVADWKERDDPILGGGLYLRVMDMSNELHEDLIRKHILFHDPDAYSLSAGLGNDWPDARGIYLNSADHPDVMIWLNAEDHLRVISMSKGGDLLDVFTRLTKALTSLEMSLRDRGFKWCMDRRLGFLNTSPENLGTALRASVFVKLPRLGQQPGFEALLDRLRLEASSRFQGGKSTGIYDIANAERLGQSEVQLINTMINGVGRLIALEKRLERGEKVDLYEIA